MSVTTAQNVSLRVSRGGVTLAILCAVAAGLVQWSDWLGPLLQFDRAAIASGEYWRIVTGNFVHWGWAHFAGDISALAGLLWLARRDLPNKTCVWLVGGLCAAVGVGVWWLAGDCEIYRGMSGVNHGLLGIVLLSKAASAKGALRYALWGVLILVCVKVICEFFNLGLLPPTGLPDNITLIAPAHAVGLICGILFYKLRD